MHTSKQQGKTQNVNWTHCLVGNNSMDLCTKHDAREEREEKSLEHRKNHEDEDQWCGENGITACNE